MSRRSLVLAVLACCAAGPARAATVAVTETLDLAQVTAGAGSLAALGPPEFEAGPAFTLAEGDALSLTVDFAGAQSVTLVNASLAWAYAFSTTTESDVLQAGTISFLDARGGVIASSAVKTDVEGTVHVGQVFSGVDLAGLPSTLTFFGVRYDGTLLDYLNPAVTQGTYAVPGLSLGGDSIMLAVPEPATGLLLPAGLAGLAAIGRRPGHRRRRRDFDGSSS